MKYLLTLLLLPTAMNAGTSCAPRSMALTKYDATLEELHKETQGRNLLRYSKVDDEFLEALPQHVQEYHREQYASACAIIALTKISLDKCRAIKAFLLATDLLLLKNNYQAVEILKVAAPYLNQAKISLAYCFRYGIGTTQNNTAAKILLDLAVRDKVLRKQVDIELTFFKEHFKLGL